MASAEDIRFANISTNCKKISIRLKDGDITGGATSWDGDVSDVLKIYIYDQDKKNEIYVTPASSAWDNSDATIIKIVTNASAAMVGVVSIELWDSADITAADANILSTIYTVAPCQINCCIAKLTDAAIECHCKCDKCKEDLLRAEKILLMLQGATFAAEQESNYDHAVNMYNKANTLCTEVCACGC